MIQKPFHTSVTHWFEQAYQRPTPVQSEAWKEIQSGVDTLIAAPTGSGKTLAAFLSAINTLVHDALSGRAMDQARILYISPLKALSNDIQKNLEAPLAGILDQLAQEGHLIPPITAKVRTGDTPSKDRLEMGRSPPHIIVTTPESLYILLTSESGRRILAGIETVIVDEIHALIQSKRGSHLALSLERLDRLAVRRPQRIGLSATQNPIERVAQYLAGGRPCSIVDQGHRRELDLSIELPGLPLEAVLSGDQSRDIHDRLAELIREHHVTLVFVNTRRLSERLARALSERLGEEAVTSHHGSLSKEQRLEAEERLKSGRLKALVATASLELGIDVGDVDLVCQFGSTRAISTFLQRVGRSGHFLGGQPKGRLFPTTRDELIECMALIDAVQRGELDCLIIPSQPLDILAQQIIATVACEEIAEDDLYALVRRADPYKTLDRETFDQVIEMASTGYSTRRGQRSAYLHHDRVHHILRPRKGAKLTAVTCGGAIPDNAEYRVILEPQGDFIGTVDEDFAIESMAGDIFQLGNNSWKVLRLEQGNLRVEDAKHQPPSIPFWFGEAPGRTHELSLAIARIRQNASEHFEKAPEASAVTEVTQYFETALHIPKAAALQASTYLYVAYRTLRCLPTFETLILERFFDEAGGMQLVIHAPLGSRANRAWGLALRKRFCRSFNFELQAAATEDAVLLSLGTSQSFDLAGVARYLSSQNVREILIQALLDAPMFTARWRWNAVSSLAIRRFQNGKKTPPYLIRMQSEDLVTAVFPDQLACLENIVGDREIPDHPLIHQTLEDCLHEAMDIDRLEEIIHGIESGRIRIEVRDLREPSPLSAEIVNARAYSFLDGAPLEERRTRAVTSRRWLDPSEATDLSAIDPAAIDQVTQEAWPLMRSAEELHDALMSLGYLLDEEIEAPLHSELEALQAADRVGKISTPHCSLWFAAEHFRYIAALFLREDVSDQITPKGIASRLPQDLRSPTPPIEEALRFILRARFSLTGPTTSGALSTQLGLSSSDIDASLLALETEGTLIQGQFRGCDEREWCDRRILSRIHHTRIKTQRQKISAVSTSVFMRFLFKWHGISSSQQKDGLQGLSAILEQIEGYEAPAKTWESEILPVRLANYDPAWLDQLCLSGKVIWSRLSDGGASTSPIRSTPIALCSRHRFRLFQAQSSSRDKETLSSAASIITDVLASRGALFFDDLLQETRMLPVTLEKGLGELVAQGWANSDGFSGLRWLLVPEAKRQRYRHYHFGLEEAGRWNLVGGSNPPIDAEPEIWVEILFRRYGILFKTLLDSETLMPSWSSLLPVLRRKEIRGEIRGGRFIAGIFGEQFALPEALQTLNRLEPEERNPALLVLNACDPLCLAGVVTPGNRIPRSSGNRVLYRGGVPVGYRIGKSITLTHPDSPEAWQLKNILLRDLSPVQLKAYLT